MTFALLHVFESKDNIPIHARYIEGQCETDGSNAFGRNRNGFLKLHANLIPVAISSPSREGEQQTLKPIVSFKLWSRHPDRKPQLENEQVDVADTQLVPQQWYPGDQPLVQPITAGSMPAYGFHSDYQAIASLDVETDGRLALNKQSYCIPLYSIDTTYPFLNMPSGLAQGQTCCNSLAALLVVQSSKGVYKRIGVFQGIAQILLEEDYCRTVVRIE